MRLSQKGRFLVPGAILAWRQSWLMVRVTCAERVQCVLIIYVDNEIHFHNDSGISDTNYPCTSSLP